MCLQTTWVYWCCTCSLCFTASLTSKCCVLYIYSTNIGTEYFKNGLCSPFFPSPKCSLFHNSNIFGSCVIQILYTECAKIKQNNSGAKRLSSWIGNCMTCMAVCLTINVIVAVIFLCDTNCSLSEENTSFLFYFCPAL